MRALVLAGVYLLMGLHVAHWRVAGRSLAPLELNEVMYTLELGIITAGFVFMGMAVLSVLLVGRFFCSWGCHILALEDLCAWLLRRVGIRPRPIRSRTLLLVPPGAMFYMFIWPQLARVMRGEGLPRLQVMSPEDPWGSFLTNDFWRNLPGALRAESPPTRPLERDGVRRRASSSSRSRGLQVVRAGLPTTLP